MCLMAYANNKGADQPAHLHSLISTIVIRCLDSMICIFALSKVSRFYLVSLDEQAGLNLTWSKIPKDTFSLDVVHLLTSKPVMGDILYEIFKMHIQHNLICAHLHKKYLWLQI